MSTKYPGGFITKDYVAPTPSSAPGIWTLDQQQQAQQAGIWPFGGPFNYIEDMFSTYLYTGNSGTQTITNGIDLSTKGGLVWVKSRNFGQQHALSDTARGVNYSLETNSSGAQYTSTGDFVSFNSNGFTLGPPTVGNSYNYVGSTQVSWTFRKQPKFFDVVTYTGDGNTTQAINHNLGSVPGCIIVKRTDSATNWFVYHKNLTSYQYSLYLNDTTGQINAGGAQFGANPTSTQFTVGSGYPNTNGGTYVAYLFAHNAGGFGLTGTDNVISCGSFTTDGSGGATVSLGYEPQWVMTKSSSTTSDWRMFDNMRGMSMSTDNLLRANTSDAESTGDDYINPTATGFVIPANGNYSASQTFIYIAIRRGPMKVPTLGTSVYNAIARTGTGASAAVTGVGFSPDLAFIFARDGTRNPSWQDKLRGTNQELISATTAAELAISESVMSFNMDGVTLGLDNYNGNVNSVSKNYINWFLKRAPSFFDEVCYTGTGTNTTVTHNLQAVPELIITKSRTAAFSWGVYSQTAGNNKILNLNSDARDASSPTSWNSTTPTATVFSLGTNGLVNQSGGSHVAYLFATCAGVSKVGSYTGTATTQTINCGFTAGARFVLIKRIDDIADWYVWDSARGIVAGNDPYLLINSTAAEVTGTDYVDTAASGFEISSTAPAAINASGGTFIFLAIA
jgi:hypothetical protein